MSQPATSGPPRSFADLHCHTSASFDSISRPAAVAQAAARRGLTHLAITDHERLEGAFSARDAAPAGLTVIVGEEVRTRSGDLIGLFIESAVPPGLPLAETAQAIHEQGGIVGLPHPFDRFRASAANRRAEDELDELAGLVDYVEGWNARLMVGNGNLRAAEFAHAHGLPVAAVSDAHTLFEVGVAYLIVDAPLDSATEMLAALPLAEMVTGRGSRLVRTAMPFAKAIQRLRGNRRVIAG
jgi:predicted metal-dependent phosphoesterase TrpH